ELVDRAARLRLRQREHPGSATESNRHLLAVEYLPAGGANLDCLPALIRQVDVDLAVSAADPSEDLALRTIKERPRLAQRERGLQSFVVRRRAGGLVVDAHQPVSEAP